MWWNNELHVKYVKRATSNFTFPMFAGEAERPQCHKYLYLKGYYVNRFKMVCAFSSISLLYRTAQVICVDLWPAVAAW